MGPYRASTWDDIEANIQRARTVAIAAWQMGYAAFCPHMNTAHFDGLAPDDVWLLGDLEWVEVSDVGIVVPNIPGLTNWQDSTGTRGEIQRCHDNLIPVYYYPDDEDLLREDVWAPPRRQEGHAAHVYTSLVRSFPQFSG